MAKLGYTRVTERFVITVGEALVFVTSLEDTNLLTHGNDNVQWARRLCRCKCPRFG